VRIAETWTDAQLRAIRDLTPSIREFEIVPADVLVAGYPLGGHINVGVMAGGAADTRSYSLTGGEGCYRIAVKRDAEGRGGSAYMWSLKPGARLRVSNAKTNFPLDYGRPDYVLIAGGIGITPLYGTALTLARQGTQLGSRFRLHYCARSADELAFGDELRAALGECLTVHVPPRRLDLAGALAGVAAGGLVMVCGPLRMLDEAKRVWKSLGRAAADLRFETFGSSGAHAPESFRVKLPQLGREIVVAEDQSMLDALESAGIGVISDCRRGECGVCAINVVGVDGTVDHRDVFFSEQQKTQNAKICACVSRAVGTIAIDPLYRPDAPHRDR
jgi:vanillate O-demethylase ferredoxin subunit